MSVLAKCKIILVISSLLLSSYASTYEYNGEDSAKLLLSGNSKNFWVEVYENRECKTTQEGLRIATFSGSIKNVEDHDKGKEFHIPASKEFIFTGVYFDAVLGANRSCKLTAGFTPEPGEKYAARFFVNDDVTQCRFGIARIEKDGAYKDELSAFTPESLCNEGRKWGAQFDGKSRSQKTFYGVEYDWLHRMPVGTSNTTTTIK